MTDRLIIETFIARVALGNREAFSQLYDATSAKLFSVCLRVLNDRELAEDVLQEAFLKVWSSAAQYQANGLSPMTWLITIARNTAIDRRRASPALYESSDEIESVADHARGPEEESILLSEQGNIARCLDELENDKAEAVRSVYLQGLTYAELADRFEVPVNTMRTWLRRSLLSLRGCLSQ